MGRGGGGKVRVPTPPLPLPSSPDQVWSVVEGGGGPVLPRNVTVNCCLIIFDNDMCSSSGMNLYTTQTGIRLADNDWQRYS